MKFRKKPVVIEAHRWYQNGDHPLDNRDRGELKEGDLVRYYRNPGMDGTAFCSECGFMFHDHGWIDTREGGFIVCPGDWIITGIKGSTTPANPRFSLRPTSPLRS